MNKDKAKSSPSSHLLVMGASSGIGLEVVKQSLAAGHQVRAFARSAKNINLVHEHLELFTGDALNPAQVRSALVDIDAVVQTLGVPFNLRLFTGPITLFSEATGLLVDAMQAADCKRLLSITGFGAGDSQASIHPLQRMGFNLVFGRAYSDKSKQEQLIQNSNLNWTIVRPGVLTNGQNTENYQTLVTPETWRNGLVSRAAVANYLVSNISDPTSFRTSPVIIG